MSQVFAEYDPTAWTEDEVLVIRTLARVPQRTQARRNAPWRSSVALSFFGLAVAAGIHFVPSASGGESELIVATHEVGDVRMERAGPGRDVVPNGYWQRLGKVVAKMPTLDDDDDGDDYEPFI